MNTVTQALKAALRDLDSLGGLQVTDETEDNQHGERWQIDTTAAANKIEQALAVSEQSLSARIEAAYDQAVRHRERMLDRRETRAERESEVKQDNIDEWISAKNGEVRAAQIACGTCKVWEVKHVDHRASHLRRSRDQDKHQRKGSTRWATR